MYKPPLVVDFHTSADLAVHIRTVRTRCLVLTWLSVATIGIDLGLIAFSISCGIVPVLYLACSSVHCFVAILCLAVLIKAYRGPGLLHSSINLLSGLGILLFIVSGFQLVVPFNTAFYGCQWPFLIILASMGLLFELISLTTPRHAPFHTLRAGKKDVPVISAASGSLFEYLTFGYVLKTIEKTIRLEGMLSIDEMPAITKDCRAGTSFRQSSTYHEFSARPRPRLFNKLLWFLVCINKGKVITTVVLSGCTGGMYFVPAFLLNRFVRFIEVYGETPPDKRSIHWGLFYAFSLFFTTVVTSLCDNQITFIAFSSLKSSVQLQLNTLLFHKVLQTKNGVQFKDKKASNNKDEDSNGASDNPQIINLFSIDTNRIAQLPMQLYDIVLGFVEVLVGTFFLYRLIGKAAFIGIGINFCFYPLSHYSSGLLARVQENLITAIDERVSITKEVLQGIRMIKFMSFESAFSHRILDTRAKELKRLLTSFYLELAFEALWSATPVICMVVALWYYTVIEGHALTPSVAFTALSVWNELRFSLNVIPGLIVESVQARISLQRLQKFFDAPVVDVVDNSLFEEGDSQRPIELRNATVTWPGSEEERIMVDVGESSECNEGLPDVSDTAVSRRFVLHEATVSFPRRQLSLVCGALGSGKSLLLLSLLGEAKVIKGEVHCPRSAFGVIRDVKEEVVEEYRDTPSSATPVNINESSWIIPNTTAYVPQTAWLQNASLKDNILFGQPYVKARYEATLEACSLLPDLALFEDGDETEIGEQGINLSGGQKIRVTLARAVYSSAEIILLDDVLAAVDSGTAQHIFHKCLKGPLMEGRTVILVSHHIQLCGPGAAYVVELDNGAVAYAGDSVEYMEKHAVSVEGAEKGSKPFETTSPTHYPTVVDERTKKLNVENHSVSEDGTPASTDSQDLASDTFKTVTGVSPPDTLLSTKKSKPKRLIDEETLAVGHVDRAVWTYYLSREGGVLYWCLMTVLYTSNKLTPVLVNYWMRLWTNAGEDDPHSSEYYITYYALFCLLGIVVFVTERVFIYHGALTASRQNFNDLLSAILYAPLRFFDTQAQGRLLNRFGKDINTVDQSLPSIMSKLIEDVLSIVVTIALVASVTPAVLVGFVCMLPFYYYFGSLFSTAARQLRRLESVSSSPLFSMYSETVQGANVIRAFGGGARSMETMLNRCDINVTYSWLLAAIGRWFELRYTILSAAMMLIISLSLVGAIDHIDASLAGFVMTFGMTLWFNMICLIRRFSSTQVNMVAVERIREYVNIESEGVTAVIPKPVPAVWPHEGAIHVENLSVRYAADLPDVLHNISFDVTPGMKVGVVGSTGSGKSTLALSFFRFVEAHSGRIVIDGIDIASISLKELRPRLTIIPQDPTIMSGTLRSTLDVFGDYEDYDIFDSLRRVHLLKEAMGSTTATLESQTPVVGAPHPPVDATAEEAFATETNASPFASLETRVEEGGSNFSQGQRQLICMARALLKRNKVIILDEATASVDYKTDQLISETIRSEFSSSTLLVIAHRLRTVIDFDRILVLEKGRIIEYDSPKNLIEDQTSRFYDLSRAAGNEEFEALKKMAV